MWKYNYYNELCHYGVKGMKWGVRRDNDIFSNGTIRTKLSEINNSKKLNTKDQVEKEYHDLTNKARKMHEYMPSKTRNKLENLMHYQYGLFEDFEKGSDYYDEVETYIEDEMKEALSNKEKLTAEEYLKKYSSDSIYNYKIELIKDEYYKNYISTLIKSDEKFEELMSYNSSQTTKSNADYGKDWITKINDMTKILFPKKYISHSGVKGMKWGVRRYQNEDGTLTELGKRRLARYNEGRKDNKKLNEDNMTKEEKTVLAENFVSDDIKNTKRTLDESRNAVSNIKNTVREIPTKRERLDLSNMSDQELREQINRERLEREYNDLFSKPSRTEKAKKITLDIINGVGMTLAVGTSAVALASAIYNLKTGKSNKNDNQGGDK